jgi:hypothetical protein
MSVAPASSASVLVAVSGVLQTPSTYGVAGNTLTFSGAPPSGTGNISVRYLGIPVTGISTTAYRTVTEFTATAGQTTFTPPSYTVGFISVFRNGVLLGSADYTATNGTTVVLTTGATAGDLVTVESFLVSSVLNAIPATAGSVSDSNIVSVSASKLTGTQTIPSATLPVGSVLQVVKTNVLNSAGVSTTSTTVVSSGITISITPKFANSTIQVQFNTPMSTGTGASGLIAQMYANGSPVSGVYSVGYSGSGVYSAITSIIYFTPATTSSQTYTIFISSTAGNIVYLVHPNTTYSLTATEIAG